MKNKQIKHSTSATTNKLRSAAVFQQKKVTASRVANFYQQLGLPTVPVLPIGEFKMFDQVEIKESTGSGV